MDKFNWFNKEALEDIAVTDDGGRIGDWFRSFSVLSMLWSRNYKDVTQ
jgi:hypothetical protein